MMTYLNNFVHKESITEKSISKENYQEKIEENFFSCIIIIIYK